MTDLMRMGAVLADAGARLLLYRASSVVFAPTPDRALRSFQGWCTDACRAFRVEVSQHGSPSIAPAMYIANHRSYLDIAVLGSRLSATFLSRDVSTWPIVGRAAREMGVVFVQRDSASGRVRAARELTRIARQRSVVVFPEGTTLGARLPAPFSLGPFRILRRIGSPVVPVTIRYSDRRAYWADKLPFGEHLKSRVLPGGAMRAEVHFGEPLLPSECDDAEQLCQRVYEAVCRPIETDGELCRGPDADL